MRARTSAPVRLASVALLVSGYGATASAQSLQWEPIEIELTASGTPAWYEFPVRVTFSHAESGKEIVLDGYWDGGRSWKVRFAPTLAGTWTWASHSADAGLDGHTGSIDASLPGAAKIAANPNLHGHLVVSQDGRRLEYADGVPFFWLGDTNWSITADRCGVVNGHFYAYVDNRKQKRFNVIQIQFFARRFYNEGEN